MDPPKATNVFPITKAFRDLKALYEGSSVSLETLAIPSPALSQTNLKNQLLAPKLVRAHTSPTKIYQINLEPIEHYFFEEPLISLFSQTRVRISSLDQRSTDDLAHSYKLNFTLKDMKKKCDVNLEILLESLKILYLSSHMDNIRTLLTCMTQLAAAFMFSSLVDLKAGKCKNILEKLDELENMVYKYLQTITAQTAGSAPVVGMHETGSLEAMTNLNIPLSDSFGATIIPKVSAPFTLSHMDKHPYKTPRSIKRAQSVLNDKLSHKEALKILARMKYVIAQLGRLLHYDSVANPVIKSVVNGENDNKTSKTKNGKKKYSDEDLDEKTIAVKIERLNKFWDWKVNKWKQSEPNKKKKNIYQILCPICEKNVKVDQGKQHLELCKERAEINKRISDLDNKLSDIVFQAFKSMKTIQKTLIVDSKQYNKLKTKFNIKGLTSRSRRASQAVNKLIQGGSLSLARSRSEENRLFLSSNTSAAQHCKNQSMQPTGLPAILKNAKSSPQQNTQKLNLANTTTQRLLEKYSARSRSREAKQRQKRSFGENPFSSPNKEAPDSENSEDVSPNPPFKISTENSEDVSPNPPFKISPTKSGPVFKHLMINTNKKNFDAFLKKEDMSKSLYLSACMKLSTPSDESDVRSNNGDTPFSTGYNQSENGSESPAISDLSFNDSFGIEKTVPNPLSRGMRSNSFAAQDVNPTLASHKKSKFYMGKEVLENTVEEDEGLKGETVDEVILESVITLDNMHTGMLRRSKTGIEELKKDIKELTKKKEKESTNFSKEDSAVIDNLKKLKAVMAQKKLKIKIFELIQTQGKVMLNQKPYHKEMELIKEDISIGLQELIEKSQSKSACTFAEKFLDVLGSRIESGKGLDETENKLFKLEGRTKKKKTSSKLLEPGLLRGKSSLPLSSPHKFTKALNGGMDDLTPTRLWSMKGSSGSKTDFIRQNQIKEENRSGRPSSKAMTEQDNENSFTEDSRIQYTLSDNRSTEKKLSGQYQYSMKEMEFGSDPKDSVQDEEEMRLVIVESKDDIAPSLWNLSLAEMPDTKKPDYDISIENICPSQKLSQENRKQSFSSSRNFTSYGNTQQSIILNEGGVQSSSNLQRPPDFFRENKTFQFGQKDVQRSMTSPNDIRAFVESNKSPTPTNSDGRTPTKQQRFVTIEHLAFTEDQPIIEISEEIPSATPSGSPTKSPANGKFKAGIKSYSGRRLTFGRKSPTAKSPSPNPEEMENGTTKKRSSLRLFNLLEKVDEGDPGQSPLFMMGYDHKTLHKKSETVVKFTGIPVEDKESPTASKLESKESIDSYSSLGSAIGEKGYFSDSEAWKPTRSLKSHTGVGIEDFEPIKMISKGAFGRVWLVRKKATKDVYAMKVINLAEKLMKNKDLENLRKENSVFSIAQEEFLVRAVFTFTHETCICFVMEYMLGGDLADLLCNYGALEEDVARFYIAELIQAVEYLHSVGIVHRDLKPDNILLDKSGHSKLTDFGLSEVGLSQKMKDVGSSPMRNSTKLFNFNSDLVKKLENSSVENMSIDRPSIRIQAKRFESKEDGDEVVLRTDSYEKSKRKANRLIGTPDYMAPEIINNVTITSYSSDWWSVGVILFELIVGVPPFNDETPEKIFENILAMKIPWDDLSIGYGEGMVTPDAADLIKKLLDPDHLQRLGANGAKEIKEHPFFKNINWATLRSQPAPVTFEHVEDTDTQNFVRMQDKISEKESHDPFVLIPKGGDVAGNLQAAKQFIETAQENFNMVNITALYSAGLKLTEETMKEKAKELKQVKDNAKKEGSRKFSDVFENPE